MRHEIVKVPVDPTLIPEAAHRFAQQALREHQRAEKNVTKAVEHAVKSGRLRATSGKPMASLGTKAA